MLQETEIVKLMKAAYNAQLPIWKIEYMARICSNLQVHTKGLLFSKVDTLFPNEHPDSKNHCVNTYEPITKGSIWKAINNIIRIFSNSSFTVSASDSTLAFINEDYFEGKNLFSYFVEQWNHQTVATDPNAYCAVYPKKYLDDFPGNMVRFISNVQLCQITPEVVAFISEDESEKEYKVEDTVIKKEVFYDPEIRSPNARNIVEKTYNQKVVCKITKKVYHLFTKTHLIRFTVEDGKNFVYNAYEFDNEMEFIPAFPLTASKLQYDVNESFVASFIPFGNLALLQHRNHRAVDLMFSYPRMSEIETPCEALNCNSGFIRDTNDPNKETACGVCRGTGWVTVQSPYKVYKKKIDAQVGDAEVNKKLLEKAPVEFHTPDVSILNYSKDSWKEYLGMAEEAVFVQQKRLSGDAESEESKRMDKEGEYSWIQNISKALNADLKRVIQAIENFENASPAEISIEQPISFALVTETEAFEALQAIISSDAPVFVKAQQVENFVHKFVSKSSPVVKALKILKLIDPLLFYSNRDVQTFKSNNVVSVEAWTTHVYAYMILMQEYEKDRMLFEKKDQVIVDLIKKGIELLKPAPAELKGALLNVA